MDKHTVQCGMTKIAPTKIEARVSMPTPPLPASIRQRQVFRVLVNAFLPGVYSYIAFLPWVVTRKTHFYPEGHETLFPKKNHPRGRKRKFCNYPCPFKECSIALAVSPFGQVRKPFLIQPIKTLNFLPIDRAMTIHWECTVSEDPI